jgi:hypothetical protein
VPCLTVLGGGVSGGTVQSRWALEGRPNGDAASSRLRRPLAMAPNIVWLMASTIWYRLQALSSRASPP